MRNSGETIFNMGVLEDDEMHQPKQRTKQNGPTQHRTVSANVRRLQQVVDDTMFGDEKLQLLDALNQYHKSRDTQELAQQLRVILTSELRSKLVPLLKQVLPRSDLPTFDYYIRAGGKRYGTFPRHGLHNRYPRHFSSVSSRGTVTSHSQDESRTYKRRSHSVESSTHIPLSQDLPLYSSPSKDRDKLYNKKPAKNQVVRVHLGEPDDIAEGFGFSIRGGVDYGIGIYVSDTIRGGVSERQGLQAGDLILEVNDITFQNITFAEANKLLGAARRLELLVWRTGRVPESCHVHHDYLWTDVLGRAASPPPETDPVGHAQSGQPAQLRPLQSSDECKVHMFVSDDANLGLTIRGGREFALGIYITGVEQGSVAEDAGLKVGNQILDVNGHSFLDVTHTEAVDTLTSTPHMVLIVKDVGKLPYARSGETPRKRKHRHGGGMSRSVDHINMLGQKDEERKQHRAAAKRASLQGSPLLQGATNQHGAYPSYWSPVIDEQACHLLNGSERMILEQHLSKFYAGDLDLNDLVDELLDLFNTPAKASLLAIISREFDPSFRSEYDTLVRHKRKMADRYNSAPDLSISTKYIQLSPPHMSKHPSSDISYHANNGLSFSENVQTYSSSIDVEGPVHASSSTGYKHRIAVRQLSSDDQDLSFDVGNRPKQPTRRPRIPRPQIIQRLSRDAPFSSSVKENNDNGGEAKKFNQNPGIIRRTRPADDEQPSRGRSNLRRQKKYTSTGSSTDEQNSSFEMIKGIEFKDSVSSQADRSKIGRPTIKQIALQVNNEPRSSSIDVDVRGETTNNVRTYPVRENGYQGVSHADDDSLTSVTTSEASQDHNKPLTVKVDIHNHNKGLTEQDSGVFAQSSDSGSPASANGQEKVEKQTTSTQTKSNGKTVTYKTSVEGDEDMKDRRRELLYGDIPTEEVTVYKSKPTLGIAIEGGANTRQPLPRVVTVQPGGSAFESGAIKVGQVILEVNDKIVVGMDHRTVARAIAHAFKNKGSDNMRLLVTEQEYASKVRV